MRGKHISILAGICCISIFFCGCVSPAFSSKEKAASEDSSKEPVTESEQSPAEDSEPVQEEADPASEKYTADGYVLEVDNDIMYVDLENPGPRNYPGEGEDRKVAFDISNAQQIQTQSSSVNPASSHPVRTSVIVSIEYYIENGQNIATKVSTDGEEHFFITYNSTGQITAVSETELTVSVTEGDHAGETLTFDLSDWDSGGQTFTVGETINLNYYTKENVHYVMSVYVPEN